MGIDISQAATPPATHLVETSQTAARKSHSKMGVKEMYELPKPRQRRSRMPKIGQAAIVVCQNVLLWVALYVAASTIYILVVGAVKFQDIPSRVMYLVAVRSVCCYNTSATSLTCVVEHLIPTLFSNAEYRDAPAYQRP